MPSARRILTGTSWDILKVAISLPEQRKCPWRQHRSSPTTAKVSTPSDVITSSVYLKGLFLLFLSRKRASIRAGGVLNSQLHTVIFYFFKKPSFLCNLSKRGIFLHSSPFKVNMVIFYNCGKRNCSAGVCISPQFATHFLQCQKQGSALQIASSDGAHSDVYAVFANK